MKNIFIRRFHLQSYLKLFACLLSCTMLSALAQSNGNLIKNAGFDDGLNAWRITDRNAGTPTPSQYKTDTAQYAGGTASLQVTKRANAMVLADSQSFPLKAQTPYAFKITYKTEDTDNASPLVVRMMVSGQGKPLIENYLWVWLPPAPTWTTKEIKNNAYFTAAGIDRGTITLMFRGKGKYWVDDLSLSEEQRHASTLDVGGQKFPYKPRGVIADPQNTPSDSLTIYQRDPRTVYPDSIPQPYEKVETLRKFATPGERIAYCFAAYPTQDETLVDITFSDLTSQNSSIPRTVFERKIVNFWKQRTAYYEQTYYIIPELVKDFEKIKIPARSSQMFWLQLQVPERTPAGKYTGTATLVFENGRSRKIPLYLNVLPFVPETTKANWIMYATIPVTNVLTQKPFTRAEQVKYFRHMNDYGITGLVPMRLWPQYDYINGKVANVKFSPMSFGDFFTIMREAGMKGPLVWEMEHLIEVGLIQKITGKPANTSKWPLKENAMPEVQEGFKTIVAEAKRQADPHGEWYYFGMDEPHNSGRMPQVEWEFKLAREAGAHTSTSVYPYDTVAQLAPIMDMDINSVIGDNQKNYDDFMALAKKHDMQYWFLGSGCYTGQEGGLMPNRYLNGFLFYKLGVPAHVSWLYSWTKGDPANDFDSGGGEPKDLCITYPSTDNANATISTLQWEGIREGITDYKYAATLQKYIDLAEKKQQPKQAEKGRQVMAKVMAAIPWRKEYQPGNSYAQPGNFPNDLADKLRWMLADEIVRLKEALNE